MSARVNIKTASYAAQAQDDGTLLVFNSSSAVTLTLPQPSVAIPNGELSIIFSLSVANIGSGTLIIQPTSSLIDGEGAISLAQYQGVDLLNDGTNFYSERGTGSGGGGSPFSVDPASIAAPNGGTTYALPSVPTYPNASFYFVNGIKRIYGTYYSISGTTLTILAANPPQTGDTHELYYS
jgi:hypothetical protein